MSTEEMVIQARELSKLIHQEQTDQEGNPHYEYLNALAEDCYFDEMKAVAYLQDAVEHQPDRISAGDIRRQFGDEIGDAVDAITRRPRESSEDYYVRLKQNPLALGVKMKDLRRRIADLENTNADEDVTQARREAYQASLNYFMN